MLLRVLVIAAIAMAAAVGWRAYEISRDIASFYEAPQGQVIGNPQGTFTIVEFMDYRCSACRLMNETVTKLIAAYPDLRVVIRHFPVYREPSILEARLALAAGKQGKFREAHEFLIARAEPMTDADIEKMIADIGLDKTRLDADMKAADVGGVMINTLATAQKYELNTIPSFIINDTYYSFTSNFPTYEDFVRVIEASRKK